MSFQRISMDMCMAEEFITSGNVIYVLLHLDCFQSISIFWRHSISLCTERATSFFINDFRFSVEWMASAYLNALLEHKLRDQRHYVIS